MKQLNEITIGGHRYQRMAGNQLSSCAQSDIKTQCWDLYRHDTPCKGGFYKNNNLTPTQYERGISIQNQPN